MLEHLGERTAAAAVMQAIERVTLDGEALTPDLGGQASTQQTGAAVGAALRRVAAGATA